MKPIRRDMKNRKSKYGPTISKSKINNDLNTFNYLINFSRIKFNDLNHRMILNEIHKYIEVIVSEFYDWEDTYINKAMVYYSDLTKTPEGIEEIRSDLISLQNNLLYIINMFKLMIQEKTLSNIELGAQIRLVYDHEINDLKHKFVMFNSEQYSSLKNKGSVCIGSALREIFIFTMINLSSMYSINRFKFCLHCNSLFFQKTKQECLYCKTYCANTVRQNRFRKKKELESTNS
jgi:hypothetical protein